MPLYDFRCLSGHTEEHFAPAGTDTYPCACGADGQRLFSSFGFKFYAVDRSTFFNVAPNDRDGRPMTLAEVQKDGRFDKQTRGEMERVRAKEERDQEKRNKRLMEEAKNEAWKEVQMKTRTKVVSRG